MLPPPRQTPAAPLDNNTTLSTDPRSALEPVLKQALTEEFGENNQEKLKESSSFMVPLLCAGAIVVALVMKTK
jgi:hypothetical protein